MVKKWLRETLKSQSMNGGRKEKPRVLCRRITENPKVDFGDGEDLSWDPPFKLRAAEWK